MDNYIEELKKQIDTLYHKIQKEKDFLVIYNLIEKERSKYQYIFSMTEIINRNLQIGNYKRVMKYYILAESLMKNIEDDKEKIRKKITDYIIKD